MSFEENEVEYKFLKAVIEGGVETRPGNVLIVATSNRRHLVKETWKDKSDMEFENDIHRSDTMEEKLSLAARFGCSICYKGDEWCAALAAGLEALGAYYGVENMICDDGDLNDETQTKQIENYIANQVDMIMVDPITFDGSSVALNKAVDAGIPIIVYDGAWAEGAEKAETTVTWDQKATGTLTGEYFINYIREN